MDFFAFTRQEDIKAQEFAYQLGASWAGDADEARPGSLDAAIIFAPVGALVPIALRSIRKDGIVVCGGIHMSDIPSFPYQILWGERKVCSVANLTRQDGIEFFATIEQMTIHTHIQKYSLVDANIALDDLRYGRINGAAVLVP